MFLILAVVFTLQVVFGASNDVDKNQGCMSRLSVEQNEKAVVYLDGGNRNGEMTWSWHVEPDRSSSTLKSPMMPDLTPEFSVDGLNWHRNLTRCLPQDVTTFEVNYKREISKDVQIKNEAFNNIIDSN